MIELSMMVTELKNIHRLLTSTFSAASLQAENLFAAIEIIMLSVAAEGSAAARPGQGSSRLGFGARP